MIIYVQAIILGQLQKVISHKYANGVISYMIIYVQAVILGQLQKVISHKYANGVISYTIIYVQAVILGPLRKKEEEEELPYWGHYEKGRKKKSGHIGAITEKKKEEEKLDVPFKSPGKAPLPGSSATSLRCTPAAASSKDAETGGAPKARKTLWIKKTRRVGHTIWNLWLVSTDIVFEHTTSIAIVKR